MAKASDNPYPSLLVVEGSAPASPPAGDQRLFIDSADHKLKRVNSSGTVTTVEGGGSSSGGVVAKAVGRFTAGAVSFTSTTWASATTAWDLTLSGVAAGDIVTYGLSLSAGVDIAPTIHADLASIVGGSPVNYWSSGGSAPAQYGVQAWCIRSGTNYGYMGMGGTVASTLVSGDISSGSVTLRLYFFLEAAGSRSINASTTLPLQCWAMALR